MSAALDEERRRQAGWTIAVAAAVTLLAVAAVSVDERRFAPPSASGPVLPGFSANANAASLIVIQSKDAIYRIARTKDGWALRDKGDYPVRRSVLAQFTRGLAGLTYGRAMTRDPEKLDRLGLGDPEKGGDGVLVRVVNAQGAYLANLVLGIEPRGAYVRDPAGTQSFAVNGDLPPLKDPAAWLDLAPITIDASRIARVDVTPEQGPPYSVRREGASARDFAFASPFDRYLVIAPSGVDGVGAAISALAPVDVAAAPAITGAVRARTVTRTFDGLVIESEIYGEGARRWLKLVAHGEGADALKEAQAINLRAAPWSYALSQTDYSAFAPPLSQLARPPFAAHVAKSAAEIAKASGPPGAEGAPSAP